jgi:hypothetical protein
MTKAKWYSPRLARETVRQLYFKAKAEGVPMTMMANRMIEKALDTNQAIEYRRDANSGIAASGQRSAGPVESTAITSP